MMRSRPKSIRKSWLLLLALLLPLALPPSMSAADKKKKTEQPAAQPAAPPKPQDTSKLVWPTPPNIGRVRYTNYYAGMPLDYTPVSEQPKKKSGWMDRLAGVQDPNNKSHFKPVPFQLLAPYRSEERRVGKECRSRWS